MAWPGIINVEATTIHLAWIAKELGNIMGCWVSEDVTNYNQYRFKIKHGFWNVAWGDKERNGMISKGSKIN